jgi:hypothetical protein
MGVPFQPLSIAERIGVESAHMSVVEARNGAGGIGFAPSPCRGERTIALAHDNAMYGIGEGNLRICPVGLVKFLIVSKDVKKQMWICDWGQGFQK